MPDKEFKRLEVLATELGGQEAGAYLESIGVTDMAEMEEEQWAEFCRRLVGGYRFALHETLRNESPF